MQKTSHNPSQNSNMELFLDLMLPLDRAWLESLNSMLKTTAVQAECDEGRAGSSCFHRLTESFGHSKAGEHLQRHLLPAHSARAQIPDLMNLNLAFSEQGPSEET